MRKTNDDDPKNPLAVVDVVTDNKENNNNSEYNLSSNNNNNKHDCSEDYEEANPFLDIDMDSFLLPRNDDPSPGRRLAQQRKEQPAAKKKRNDFGLPTFRDQMDRGIRTYTLRRRLLTENNSSSSSSNDDNNNIDPVVENNSNDSNSSSVTIHIEHRLHSTGSDIWDAALVLSHALSLPSFVDRLYHRDHRAFYSSHNHRLLPLQNKVVVELGSGTGVVGIFCSRCLGAGHVVLTDLETNLPLIRKNCAENGLLPPAPPPPLLASSSSSSSSNDGDNHDFNHNHDNNETKSINSCQKTTAATNHHNNVSITPLDWNDFRDDDNNEFPPSIRDSILSGLSKGEDVLILGSDVFLPYAPHLLVPLCRTIHGLLRFAAATQQRQQEQLDAKKPQRPPMAVLCYEKRFDGTNLFFEHARTLGLRVRFVDHEHHHPCYKDPHRIYVVQITLSSHDP